jgi:hypothetical protein
MSRVEETVNPYESPRFIDSPLPIKRHGPPREFVVGLIWSLVFHFVVYGIVGPLLVGVFLLYVLRLGG